MSNKFQLSLDVVGYDLMVGVAKRNTDTNGGVFTKQGSYMLYMYNENNYNCYINGGATVLGQKNQFGNGSRLTVSLALNTKQLSFELDSALVHSVALPNTSDLFAAVDLRNDNTTVSFV